MGGQTINAEPGAVAVQVAGDGNSVTVSVGRTSLVIDRKHRLSTRHARTDLQLLLTELREIDLLGRDAELTQLVQWLNADAEISVRCLTGRAGAGKSRLAIELCERAEADGWSAGFVRHDGLGQDLSGWHWCDLTLIVVDNVAASARDLRRWLDALANREPGAKKLRLLLLERHATPGVGWWDEVFGGGAMTGLGPADLLDPQIPIPLSGLRSAADRRRLLAQVMAKSAALNKISPTPRPPEPGADPDFDRRLAEDTLDNEPLFLAMAGIVAAGTSAPSGLALSRTDLAERVARGEEDRLKRLAQDRGSDAGRLLTHLAACVTLQGGCDRETAEALVNDERSAMGYPVAATAEALANLLRAALPKPGSAEIDAIRPDFIGEAFLLHEVQREERPLAKQLAIVERAFRREPLRVVKTIVRTAQDYCDGRNNHVSLLWFDHLIGLIDDPIALMAIADALPQQTVGLRERAADTQRLVVITLRAAASADLQVTPHLAGALTRLAVRLSDLGDREAALDAAREAVDIRRALAAQRPDAFRPDLALSLNTLANRLSDLGDREAALDAAREAVDIRRALAAQRPDAFRPDLAGSLNTLANQLRDLGDREAALDAAREAADLYRALAAQLPDAFRPDLALSLNTLANRLSDLGDREAALDAAREAVDIRRALAAQRPDAFRPDLAGSLNTLANQLRDLGDREAALDAAREAADLYRALAAQLPDAFRPDLALSLNNLGVQLSALGDREAALDAAREAVDLYRALDALRPDAFRPDLAGSLNNLANQLSDLGDREVALDVAREAVDLYRALDALRPDAFRPDLALSLNNLADRLSDLGDREAALDAAREAVDLYRALDALRPDAFRPDLALSLNTLANRLSDLGDREAALDAAREAVDIRRALAAQLPDAFRPYLAVSLGVLADCLESRDMAAALAASVEAIQIHAGLFAARPAVFASQMEKTGDDYVARCARAGFEPDMALLAPITTIFETLRASQENAPS